MASSVASLLFLLSLLVQQVKTAPAPQLYRRDDVAFAKLALIELKASSFCSSVIGLHDSTVTRTYTGPTGVATTTVAGLPCTSTAAAGVTTTTSVVTASTMTSTTTTTIAPATVVVTTTAPAATSTTTTALPAVTNTVTATPSTVVTTSITLVTPPLITSTATSTSTSTTTVTTTTYATVAGGTKHKRQEAAAPLAPRASAPACSIKNLPPALNGFVCDVITQACSEFVHPQTVTVSTTVPGPTSTITKTNAASCAVYTPPASIATVVSTTTPAAVTTTVTVTPAATTTTQITTPPAAITTATTQLPASTVTTTLGAPSTTVTATSTVPGPVTTITTTTTTTATATATVTGKAYGTNDCVNGKQVPASDSSYKLTEYCGATLSSYSQVSSSTQSSFSACIQSCNTFGACDAVIYNIATGQCILSNGAYRGPVQNFGFDTAVINV